MNYYELLHFHVKWLKTSGPSPNHPADPYKWIKLKKKIPKTSLVAWFLKKKRSQEVSRFHDTITFKLYLYIGLWNCLVQSPKSYSWIFANWCLYLFAYCIQIQLWKDWSHQVGKICIFFHTRWWKDFALIIINLWRILCR